ncbi:MAG: PHP domain-containing protein [Thermodesulfobacteriota bacterium]
MRRIDLHTHSTASDGCLTPTELVERAASLDLAALALTDHDTVAGLDEARAAAARTGVELIAGCELSVVWPVGFMHILGLFLPERPERLMAAMDHLMARRHDRNRRIVDKLNGLGLELTYAEVQAIAGEGSVGRPHLALAMQARGYVADVEQAFQEYLGARGRAYVPKDHFTPEQALAALKVEGATTVLAHPFSLRATGRVLENKVRKLKDLGLDGLECLYPEHSPDQTREFLRLARKLDLAVTGGSDFHGFAVKPDIELGVGGGNLELPYAMLDSLRERRSRQGLPA